MYMLLDSVNSIDVNFYSSVYNNFINNSLI